MILYSKREIWTARLNRVHAAALGGIVLIVEVGFAGGLDSQLKTFAFTNDSMNEVFPRRKMYTRYIYLQRREGDLPFTYLVFVFLKHS